MAIIIKTSMQIMVGERILTFVERAYKKPEPRLHDRAFVWTSETAGGTGLAIRGRIEKIDQFDHGKQVQLEISALEYTPERPLTKDMLAPYRDIITADPIAGLARKLYRHAHDKIAELTDDESAFLDGFFSRR